MDLGSHRGHQHIRKIPPNDAGSNWVITIVSILHWWCTVFLWNLWVCLTTRKFPVEYIGQALFNHGTWRCGDATQAAGKLRQRGAFVTKYWPPFLARPTGGGKVVCFPPFWCLYVYVYVYLYIYIKIYSHIQLEIIFSCLRLAMSLEWFRCKLAILKLTQQKSWTMHTDEGFHPKAIRWWLALVWLVGIIVLFILITF